MKSNLSVLAVTVVAALATAFLGNSVGNGSPVAAGEGLRPRASTKGVKYAPAVAGDETNGRWSSKAGDARSLVAGHKENNGRRGDGYESGNGRKIAGHMTGNGRRLA